MAGSSANDDRTAKARIRDAAIARFANEGFAPTNVKDVAADAGVSPALVIHHFGSKDGLRAECDALVARIIKEHKTAAMEQGSAMDPFAAVRAFGDDPPVMRYVARTLADSSPAVNDLVDQMVDDAEGYMRAGIEAGLIKPVDNVREMTVVVTIWSLGSMVLHDHARRLLGIDIVDGAPEDRLKWMAAALPIFTDGLLLNGDALKQTFAQHASTDGEDGAASNDSAAASKGGSAVFKDAGVDATRPDPPAAT